eukprot:1050956-Amphidinium_carterae.1
MQMAPQENLGNPSLHIVIEVAMYWGQLRVETLLSSVTSPTTISTTNKNFKVFPCDRIGRSVGGVQRLDADSKVDSGHHVPIKAVQGCGNNSIFTCHMRRSTPNVLKQKPR